jgi:hypothetical protein
MQKSGVGAVGCLRLGRFNSDYPPHTNLKIDQPDGCLKKLAAHLIQYLPPYSESIHTRLIPIHLQYFLEDLQDVEKLYYSILMRRIIFVTDN